MEDSTVQSCDVFCEFASKNREKCYDIGFRFAVGVPQDTNNETSSHVKPTMDQNQNILSKKGNKPRLNSGVWKRSAYRSCLIGN